MKPKDTPFYKAFKPQVSLSITEKTTCIRRAHGYIYFRIPKAANTMISSNLYLSENGRFDLNSEEINSYKVNFERPSSLTEKEIANLDRYFKFTVVRNPATRILSCYLQKVLGNANEKRIVTKDLGLEDNAYISFENFLDWLGKGTNIKKNYHWALQTHLIPIGIKALDFIGKTETLKSDLDYILVRIFGANSDPCLVNFSPGKTNANDRQKEYFTPGIRKKIFALYQADFEAFGYDFSN